MKRDGAGADRPEGGSGRVEPGRPRGRRSPSPAANEPHGRIHCLKEEQILEAAAGLFGGRDLSLVTMEEVAALAGVAKGTLYNYFPSKEALYASILTARMNDLLENLGTALRLEEETRVRLRKFVAEDLTFLLDHPDFLRMLRKEETRLPRERTAEVRELRERLRNLLREALGRGMEEGSIRRVSTGWATDLILGTVEGAALRCIEEGCTAGRRAEESEALFDFLWRSISVANGSREPEHDLVGTTVLITREEEEGGELSSAIERLGGTPIRLPLVRTAPPSDPERLRRAAAELSRYDWILFTSARGVDALSAAWREAGSPPIRPGSSFGAVGESTARAVRERFGRVDLVAPERSGEGLAAALRARGVDGARCLLPRAEQGSPDLPRLLRASGAFVDDVAGYRTEAVESNLDPALDRLRDSPRAVVVFASPSAVCAFADLAGFDSVDRMRSRVRFATIGVATSAALRSFGFEPDAEAQQASFTALAAAAARAASMESVAKAEPGRTQEGGSS